MLKLVCLNNLFKKPCVKIECKINQEIDVDVFHLEKMSQILLSLETRCLLELKHCHLMYVEEASLTPSCKRPSGEA